MARLILSNAGEAQPDVRPHEVEERWVLARLDATRAEVERAFASFEFSRMANALYHLTFDDFCDWYAEAIKPRLYEGDEDARATALAALERLLKLLHPVLPHVTEEIWSQFRDSRLIVAPWPEPTPDYQDAMDALERVQIAARIYRRSKVRIDVTGENERIFEAVVRPAGDGKGDVEAERERVRAEKQRAERKLADERFVENAPPEVVDAERRKLAQYDAELDALGD